MSSILATSLVAVCLCTMNNARPDIHNSKLKIVNRAQLWGSCPNKSAYAKLWTGEHWILFHANNAITMEGKTKDRQPFPAKI